jgi:hypothetical protein
VRIGTALAWYLRLLFSQELEKGVTLTQFSLKSGIHKSRLSRLSKSAEGTGLEFLNGFTRYFGRSQGDLLDESLRWWNKKGQEYALRETRKKLQADEEDLDRRARRTSSSERLIAIPSHLRPPSEPVGKK